MINEEMLDTQVFGDAESAARVAQRWAAAR
jgi:hypothetical protein